MKLKKKMVALMLASAVVLSSAGSYMQVEAKCSGYTEYRKERAFCDNTHKCEDSIKGFFGMKTIKHKSFQERYCDIKGEQKKQRRVIYVVDGCGWC